MADNFHHMHISRESKRRRDDDGIESTPKRGNDMSDRRTNAQGMSKSLDNEHFMISFLSNRVRIEMQFGTIINLIHYVTKWQYLLI